MTSQSLSEVRLTIPAVASGASIHQMNGGPSISPTYIIPQESNLLYAWFNQRLCSRDRVERHYNGLIALLFLATILFAAIKMEGYIWTWGSKVCTLWALALLSATLINIWAEQRDRAGWFEATRGIQFLLCMLSVLIYYNGSNVVNQWRFAHRGPTMLYDPILLKMDEFFLGWMYPRGQMALYLDTQTEFGVTTDFGRLYAEVFQWLYVSYYFWGNVIGVALAGTYFWKCVYKKEKRTKKRLQWRRIQMYVSAWVGVFVMNHLVNLCFPAMSPRIFISDSFQNELRGVWLLNHVRGMITKGAANTYSAFPSGHCGLSLLAIVLSFRTGMKTWYSWMVVVSSVLIILATQVLRYHYFVDFLFSLPLVAMGTWFGGFHDLNLYNQCLIEQGEEDHDEDGKPMGSPGGVNGYTGSESSPLISQQQSGASSTGLTRSASRSSLHDVASPDIEMGRLDPPLVLSSGLFGSITRSTSSQRMNEEKSEA